MKKKRTIVFLAACVMIIAGGIGWSTFTDYSGVLESNWGIALPWKARLSEIYEKDSEASFHGDGIRYHVYSYRYEDYIDLMFAWPLTEYPTQFYATTSEAAEVWLDEIEAPQEERPDYRKCASWSKSKEDGSEIIFFWDNALNRLYIVENIL